MLGGTVSIEDGTVDVDDVTISAASIRLAKDTTLDIDTTKAIELTGAQGDVVFSAADGSTVNVYVDEQGGTRFVAKTFNTYMDIGST